MNICEWTTGLWRSGKNVVFGKNMQTHLTEMKKNSWFAICNWFLYGVLYTFDDYLNIKEAKIAEFFLWNSYLCNSKVQWDEVFIEMHPKRFTLWMPTSYRAKFLIFVLHFNFFNFFLICFNVFCFISTWVNIEIWYI